MFFPFCCNSNSGYFTSQDFKRMKLDRLKAMRDFLEARLAATNAEIETVERQMGGE